MYSQPKKPFHAPKEQNAAFKYYRALNSITKEWFCCCFPVYFIDMVSLQIIIFKLNNSYLGEGKGNCIHLGIWLGKKEFRIEELDQFQSVSNHCA